MAKVITLDPTIDNAPALAQMAAGITGPCRLIISEGKYPFSKWPTISHNRVEIVAAGPVDLIHTGSGDAITFDGGQNGMFNCRFTGFTIVPGPNTLRSLVLNSFHHSRVDVRVHGAGAQQAAIYMGWCVCTEVRPVISINEATLDGHPFTPNFAGLVLDANPVGSGNRTTACVIRQPILEGLSEGIVIRGADFCTIDGAGGTVEDGINGVVFDGGSYGPGSHVIDRLEMENNSGWDVYFGSNAHNNRVVFSGNPKLKVYNASATLKELIPNNKVISTTDIL